MNLRCKIYPFGFAIFPEQGKRSKKYSAKTTTLVDNLYRTFSPHEGRCRQAEG